MTRRCAVYARISVATEASVSIARQVEAAEQYAAARGWTVAGAFVDDGVSASRNRPEDRAGWATLLDSAEAFDAVLVWKIDRLARRVLDFLHADAALQARGAGIVSVSDPVDMTTAQGRAFATMLAVFAEMESEATRARVKGARDHLIRAGRVVGGTIAYGWMSIPNPDGPGFVLAQDPARVGFVRTMVERTRAGASIYSTVQHLDEIGAPLPTVAQQNRRRAGWSYSTVERLLRSPVLAGMTPVSGGVLRGADGLPVVRPDLAIMSVADWRALVRQLDERPSAQTLPVAMRAKTSGLLSGLLWCAADEKRMWRGTTQGRPGYYCPACHMVITRPEPVVVAEFLRQKGPRVRWSPHVEVLDGPAAMLPEIEVRLGELTTALQRTDDDAEAAALAGQIAALRALRREARAAAPVVEVRPTRGDEHFDTAWAAAGTDEARRAVLDDAVERIWVRRGATGRRTDEQVLARLTFIWKIPEDLGPLEE